MDSPFSSISAYEFTLRAKRRLEYELDHLDPVDFDSEHVYHYLCSIRPVPFHLYLKRFLYREAGLSGEFHAIPNEVYVDIIKRSFYEQGVPFSHEETVKKPSAIIKGWLSRDTVKRKTLFLLGFGLRMSDAEVSDFLAKAMGEVDFDFSDPEETLYWHCFHTGKGYRKMLELHEKAEEYKGPFRRDGFYETVFLAPAQYLADEEVMTENIVWLKENRERFEKASYEVWIDLYRKLGERFSMSDEKKIASEIENRFCSATPRTASDNQSRFSQSDLAEHFGGYRITRQRLEHIRKKQTNVSRFDLITLYFYLYGNLVQDEGTIPEPFVGACNRILESCRMRPLYEVNPYEAFLILASKTDFPLDLYSEVIELSYSGMRKKQGGAL